MKQGDIVLVPFPFADRDASSLHPAVVISVIKHRAFEDVVISMISSNVSKCVADDVMIESVDPEYPVTQLKVDSCIKTGKIATVTRTRITRRLGHLGPNKHKEFVEKLKRRLSL